jgi:peptide/nickel transport system ATP-binding protein
MIAPSSGIHEPVRTSIAAPLIEIEKLSIGYRSRDGQTIAVLRDVNLRISAGERLGIAGESGCGKSTLALALLGYLRRGGLLLDGDVRFHGRSLFQDDDAQTIRGRRIALVPQNAGQALTPTLRIQTQIEEAVRTHRSLGGDEAREIAISLLRAVQLPDPETIGRRFPHQLSGGQLQRVGIALALTGNPELLVLDEPTTGLDVTTQAAVLETLDRIRRETGIAMISVSHDLAVIAHVADRLVVMYAGEIVENGPVDTLFKSPRHPYTRALIRAVPRIDRPALPVPLEGQAATPGRKRAGCAFAPRCALKQESCLEAEIPLTLISDSDHLVRCLRWDAPAPSEIAIEAAAPVRSASGTLPVLNLQNLSIDYAVPGLKERLLRRAAKRAPVVEDISFRIDAGETVALVGESGSGKSTIARAIAGAIAPLNGQIELAETRLAGIALDRTVAQRKAIQFVFQNPDGALNPRQTVSQLLERPLQLFTGLSRRGRQERMEQLLSEVRLSSSYLERLPGQLSGGEKQRVAIARGLAADPTLLLCDEIVSALDVSVQAAILQLLTRIQREREISYLFVSHDLAVVRALADRVIVLYRGRVCETGPTEAIFSPPYHPYTKSLLEAALVPDPGRISRPAIPDRPTTGPVTAGCPFADRCPRKIANLCDREPPPWRETPAGHAIRCHLPTGSLSEA